MMKMIKVSNGYVKETSFFRHYRESYELVVDDEICYLVEYNWKAFKNGGAQAMYTVNRYSEVYPEIVYDKGTSFEKRSFKTSVVENADLTREDRIALRAVELLNQHFKF